VIRPAGVRSHEEELIKHELTMVEVAFGRDPLAIQLSGSL
jgi:hypothetical protein